LMLAATSTAAETFLTPSTNTSTLNFTDSAGIPVGSYAAGSNIFVSLTDAGANTSISTVQTYPVVVKNATNGDFETITLTETGVNTGVFRNLSGLPSSLSSGVGQQDGTLNVAAGDGLTVAYNN